MVSHSGGSKNIIAVYDKFEILDRLGFNHEHIVKMVSRLGGSNKIEAVIYNFESLQVGRTLEEIVKVVISKGNTQKTIHNVCLNSLAKHQKAGQTMDHVP